MMEHQHTEIGSAMPANLLLDEDIVSEILTRLSAKEIARLRCVCKRWLSLTSSPRFIQHHSARNPRPSPSGFFLCDHINGAKYFPLNGNPPALPDPTLSFIPTAVDEDRMSIESPCNGLIICYRATKRQSHRPAYYVCNPTTREFVELPVPKEVDCNFSLIFDPSKSPHYKVVSISPQIHIYSSQTRSWKLSVDKKRIEELGGLHAVKRGSVYWNSTLILAGEICFLSFDPEGECIKKLLMPPEAPEYSKVVYMGESGEKLRMIARSDDERSEVFHILEMDPQCSQWSILSKVDLESAKDLYPETQERSIWTDGVTDNIRRAARNYLRFAPVLVLVIRGGEEKGGRGGILVLNMPGKIISYDLAVNVFKEVWDLSSPMRSYHDLSEWRKFFFFSHTLFSP